MLSLPQFYSTYAAEELHRESPAAIVSADREADQYSSPLWVSTAGADGLSDLLLCLSNQGRELEDSHKMRGQMCDLHFGQLASPRRHNFLVGYTDPETVAGIE